MLKNFDRTDPSISSVIIYTLSIKRNIFPLKEQKNLLKTENYSNVS
jgi:hypothetical protein